MEKRIELLKALDDLNGGSDWKDMKFEFYCFWSNNRTSLVPPGYMEKEEEALLKQFGFDLNARFVFRVHYVSYSSVGHESYTVAHIIRKAILDPEYDMEQFRERHTRGLGGCSYGTKSTVTINPRGKILLMYRNNDNFEMCINFIIDAIEKKRFCGRNQSLPKRNNSRRNRSMDKRQ